LFAVSAVQVPRLVKGISTYQLNKLKISKKVTFDVVLPSVVARRARSRQVSRDCCHRSSHRKRAIYNKSKTTASARAKANKQSIKALATVVLLIGHQSTKKSNDRPRNSIYQSQLAALCLFKQAAAKKQERERTRTNDLN